MWLHPCAVCTCDESPEPAQLLSEHKACKGRTGQQSCTQGGSPSLEYLDFSPPVTELEIDPNSVHPQNISSCLTRVARESWQWSCSLPTPQRKTGLVVAPWSKFCLLLRVLHVRATRAAVGNELQQQILQ